MSLPSGFQRHRDACNNAALPGVRVPLLIAGSVVGYLHPSVAAALEGDARVHRAARGITLREPAMLHALAQEMSRRGLCRFRNEAFDVRAEPGGPVLATIDRGALPAFGIAAEGVHVNGLVRRADGLHVWVARRSAHKLLDPGKLDHLVAGGISAGMTPWETLIKEAAEEASLPEALAVRARKVAEIAYAMERPEGLRRDILHCYDLHLPEEFVPQAGDDEVASFELWPLDRVYAAVRDTDDFKFNVALVLIDLFGRFGLFPDASSRTGSKGLAALGGG